MSVMLLAPFALGAAAHDIVRTKTWTWIGDSSAPDSVTCTVEEDDQHPWYVNQIGKDWNVLPGQLLYHHHRLAQELLYTDFSGTHRIQLPHVETSSLDGYEKDEAMLRVVDAFEAWLVHTSDPEREYAFDASRVSALRLQWHDHWCVDEDDDGYCDQIELPDETRALFTPPMRTDEQTALASCLNSTRYAYQQVERTDYMVSGAENWPRLLKWAKDCQKDIEIDAPMNPLPVPEISPLDMCALFYHWYWPGTHVSAFIGDGTYAYMCELDKQFNDDYTGHGVRDEADEARGEFAGFVCPEDEQSQSFRPKTLHDVRFNSSGLRTIESPSKDQRPRGISSGQNGLTPVRLHE